ncbi:hypothetical protein THIX_60734 [Thiomonas sp. X19]|nr:hypothetical protein [Thiomonas sp. X19]SCC93521.1 hypothetical protein THIX_30749 [Thiomonas sp. X19]SCC94676.1 hypothetical protein THIX_60734 [Thiomonas sp. X19]
MDAKSKLYRNAVLLKTKKKSGPMPELAPRRDPLIWALFGPNYKPTGAKS